jgi:hypothetical protein
MCRETSFRGWGSICVRRLQYLCKTSEWTTGWLPITSKVFEVPFPIAQHDFVRSFYFQRELRAADIVLDLSWSDDEQATLKLARHRASFFSDGWYTVVSTLEVEIL